MRPSGLSRLSKSPGQFWLFLAVAGFCLVSFATFSASGEVPVLVVMPVVIPMLAIVAIVLLLACAGSPVAGLVFLVLLVFVNDALFRVRDPGEIGLDWQNAMKMALWGGAALIGICRTWNSENLFGRPLVIACFAYLAIALLSTVWSVTPTYSGATAFGMLALMLFAMGTTTLLSEKQILVGSAVALTAFVAAGWVVYVAVPDLGQSPFIKSDGSIVLRICGIAGQANALGHVLTVYLGVLFLLWYRGHTGTVVLLLPVALGLVTLSAADSRSSLVGLVVAITAVVARRTLWLWATSMLATLCATLALLAVPLPVLIGLSETMSRSGDPSELFTLTGRTDIWQFSWERIVEQPWLGYGYNSSKVILPQFLGIRILVDEAHNMFLQSLLSGGVLGTMPLVAICLLLLFEYVRAPNPMRDLFFWVMLIGGITEAGAFGSTPALLTLFLFIGIARSHMKTPDAVILSEHSPVRLVLADQQSATPIGLLRQ